MLPLAVVPQQHVVILRVQQFVVPSDSFEVFSLSWGGAETCPLALVPQRHNVEPRVEHFFVLQLQIQAPHPTMREGLRAAGP